MPHITDSYSRNLKKIILLLVLVIICFGAEVVEYFNFSNKTITFDEGLLHLGFTTSVDGKSNGLFEKEYRNPYSFYLTFETQDDTSKYMKIKELIVTSESGEAVVVALTKKTVGFKESYKKTDTGSLLYATAISKGIILHNLKYHITGMIEIVNEQGAVTKSFNQVLEVEYEKYIDHVFLSAIESYGLKIN